MRECLIAGVLCNDARLFEREGHWRWSGIPTEAALLVAARKGGIDQDRAAGELPRLDTIPFESERQFMATLHRAPRRLAVVYVKGATERVIAMCSGEIAADGTAADLNREQFLRRPRRSVPAGCGCSPSRAAGADRR